MKFILFLMLTTSILGAFAQEVTRPRLGTSINGMGIGGLEYWPFTDERSFKYPEDVLWSFDEGSTAAQKCAIEANKKLVGWLEDIESPVYKQLAELKKRGGVSSFFMWVNDYSTAPQTAQNGMRASRVWHWCSPGTNMHTNPSCGWLKFESKVKPDGTCVIPEVEATVSFLQTRIDALPEVLQPDTNAINSSINNSSPSTANELRDESGSDSQSTGSSNSGSDQ